jgi:hypothetical protein
MGLRDLARKGLGLLVEIPEEDVPTTDPATAAGLGTEVQSLRTKSIGELLQELDTAAPGAPDANVTFEAPPAEVVQDGLVDFQAIYQRAGVPQIAFTAEQTLELIRTLPAELPLATKRQTLEVSLNTLGKALNISKEQVLLDANQKLQALAAYEDAARQQRDGLVAKVQQRVKELEAEIQSERQKAADEEARYLSVVKQCEAQGSLLDEVQEFLTLDQGPSEMGRVQVV